MKKIYELGIMLVFLAVIMTAVQVQIGQVTPQVQGLHWNSEVCIYKNNELIQCEPNILCTGGKNWTRDCIGKFLCGSTNFSIIALGNTTTAQSASDTTLANEWTTCNLGRKSGEYTELTGSSDGNWTVSAVWTANDACVVNTTGLFNATSSGTMFAQNNFTTVSLQANDQINVTWTIWVT